MPFYLLTLIIAYCGCVLVANRDSVWVERNFKTEILEIQDGGRVQTGSCPTEKGAEIDL